MASSDNDRTTILRNKLLGRWAAEQLGLAGPEADAYSDALAAATLDPELCDVFSKVRKDFDAAGVAQSDEQILRVMTELMLKAGACRPAAQGDSVDAAAVMLAKTLTSR